MITPMLYRICMLNHIHFNSIDSTSTYARNNCENASLPLLITADSQSAGRGRRGNTFYSPDKTGLYMTLLFEADECFDLLTPGAAVCVCKILEEDYGVFPKIKWVNDLFLNGKKVCGILTERFASGGKTLTAIGIGVNLEASAFPSDLPFAGSLNIECDKNELAEKIGNSVLKINENYERNFILSEYKKRLSTIGQYIGYTFDGKDYSGIAADINDQCNLIVNNDDGTNSVLSSGEISIKVRKQNEQT